MQDEKQLIIFAGPNGSGKSTLTKLFGKFLTPLYINADELASVELKKLQAENLNTKQITKINLAAAQKADTLREAALERGESFTTETVMSTPAKIELMRKAKNYGYEILLIYVSTTDYKINLERIKGRIFLGGHAVAEAKVKKRYAKAVELMPAALQVADHAYVYDNSARKAVLVLSKEFGEITLYSDNRKSHSILKNIKTDVVKINKQFEAIQKSKPSKLLSSLASAKVHYNSYAKEALFYTGCIWRGYNLEQAQNFSLSTDAKIYEFMVRDKFSLGKIKDILLENPELYVKSLAKQELAVDNFILLLENTEQIKQLRKQRN